LDEWEFWRERRKLERRWEKKGHTVSGNTRTEHTKSLIEEEEEEMLSNHAL
jgi:hypothetical protein